jgi:outer membrane protein assembly factor BamB
MTQRLRQATVALALIALTHGPAATSAATAEDGWTRFRGPNGSGIAESSALPVDFGPTTNVVWKTPLASGFSSPVIAGDRIFVTGLDGDELKTIALDRSTGEVLWEQVAPRPRQENVDFRSHPAAASAVVADNELYVFFHDYGLLSYDFDGEERWDVPLGPFSNIYGMGASPVIVGDLLILVCDQEIESFIAAYDRATGAEVWRVARPQAHSGHSTPILWETPEGEPQLLVAGSFLLDAYDPATGERLWWVKGLSFEMKSTPVIHNGVAFINGYGSPNNQPGNQVFLPPFEEVLPDVDANGDGLISPEEMPPSGMENWWFGVGDYAGDGQLNGAEWEYLRSALASRNGMLAIKLGGSGDMSEQSLLWEYNKAVPQLPSPLVYHDILYMVNDGGIVTSFEPTTGEVLAQGRLKGAIDQYYASPIAADGKIFMLSEMCMLSVLEPDGGLAPVAVSDLDDLCHATPAIADGRIYVRTRNHLYAFGLTD